MKTTILKSTKKASYAKFGNLDISESESVNATWVNNSKVFRASRGLMAHHKYSKLFKSFAQRKASNLWHCCSQSQIFTEANILIMSPVWYVVKYSLWRPNILSLFNLGWENVWWLQHSIAAVLLFLKQPYNIIWFDLALQKCFVTALQLVYRGKCLICLFAPTA